MAAGGAGRFVVQEHRARTRHFDLRLEVEGVLKSWAVPKGPSLDPACRRLAVQVEDHDLAHLDYEGIIPDGHAGAGPVVIWDRGTYRAETDPAAALERGRLTLFLEGATLRGGFTLLRPARRGRGNEWLLIKARDAWARPGWEIASALTPERLRRLRPRVPPCATG